MPPLAPFFAWTGFAIFLVLAAYVLWAIAFILVRAVWQATFMVRLWAINAEPGNIPMSLGGYTRLFLRLLGREIGAGIDPYTTIQGPWGTLGYLPWKENQRRADEQAAWDAEDKETAL